MSLFHSPFGNLLALEMKGRHLEAFVDDLKAKGHALDYIQKHVISIGAMYRKGQGRDGSQADSDRSPASSRSASPRRLSPSPPC